MDTSRREAPWRLALGLFCLLVSQGSCGISPQANAFPIAAETSSSIPSPVFGGGGGSAWTVEPAVVSGTLTQPPSPPRHTLQLTYVAPVGAGAYGIFAVALGCLEDEHPCLSGPRLLFEEPYPALFRLSIISWSPDGSRIAYSAVGVSDRLDIFVADSDGRNRANMTGTPTDEDYPAWSPDGKSIAYSSCPVDGCSVFGSSPDGSDRIRLLTLAQVRNPSQAQWSPDGLRMVFAAFDESLYPQDIYTSNVGGSSLLRLTKGSSDNRMPTFSPDGRWIAYSKAVDVPGSLGGQTQNIFLIRPDGSDARPLAPDLTAQQTFPAWCPRGGWLAFNSFSPSTRTGDIFIVSEDGGRLIRITNTPNEIEANPAWRMQGMP